MKLQQAIDRVDEVRPNMLSRELKIAALSELDGMIWKETIITHYMYPAEILMYMRDEVNGRPKMPEYDADTDPGMKLLVPPPHDNLYLYWLMAKVDEQTLEQEKYNNDIQLFTSNYQNFADYWNRTHMPVSITRELRI